MHVRPATVLVTTGATCKRVGASSVTTRPLIRSSFTRSWPRISPAKPLMNPNFLPSFRISFSAFLASSPDTLASIWTMTLTRSFG